MQRHRRLLHVAVLVGTVAVATATAGATASAQSTTSAPPGAATGAPARAGTGVGTTTAGARTTDMTAAGTATVDAGITAAEHTVTFVNHSGQTLWIGSAVNADGSKNFTSLPTLAPGQSATVTIPENSSPNHWRGKFFARQGCTGTSGSTFHCLVGDCGVYADHCTTGEQPTSLAEFNFDTADSLAPWYNVSYVNAFSLPVSITPNNAPAPPAGGGSCETMGCTEDLLPYCPSAYASTDPATGRRILCTNPNRDAQTAYSDAITAHCPKAYAWSKQDTVPGNAVMRQCSSCTGFTVTFSGASVSTPTGAITGPGGKCVDVASSGTSNGTPIQIYTCNGTAAQQWTVSSDGSLRAFGKCMDVTAGSTASGAKIQLYDCNGTGAQQWSYNSANRSLLNPQSAKCLDLPSGNTTDRTQLQIWDCNGSGAQQWNLPA